MHIGNEITRVLSQKQIAKANLGGAIGITGSAMNYLLKRESVDVETLHKVSNVLKYNFFKHYPVEEDAASMAAKVPDERDKVIAELKGKISELEKQLDMCKREMMMQENGFLKKINELLERK